MSTLCLSANKQKSAQNSGGVTARAPPFPLISHLHKTVAAITLFSNASVL